MFKKPDKELMRLQQELLAAEEEDLPEEETEELDLEDLDFPEEEEAGEDYEEYFDSDYEEEYEQEPFYRNHANDYGENVKNFANHYGKGSPKRFEDDDLDFEEADFDDTDVLYRDDYRKAKKKKKRQNMGLVILAILELLGIAAILLWWASWML